jgi:3-deoxy-D-manno-octulosonate 8-phosphate phosphatase (KDO 8-P phosphatase)
MGDDLPDYKVMQQVVMPCCPQDAVPEIKALSRYVSHLKGGQGCVRDVIEQVLKVQEKWNYSTTISAKYD